jgi:hypothetical protein
MIARKPTILIFTVRPDEALLRELCAGMEEEGVLYDVIAQPSGDATALAATASGMSMLGSGVGLVGRSMALHIKGMTTQSPLLGYADATGEQAREIGANAARVIKKLPLRLGDGN